MLLWCLFRGYEQPDACPRSSNKPWRFRGSRGSDRNSATFAIFAVFLAFKAIGVFLRGPAFADSATACCIRLQNAL